MGESFQEARCRTLKNVTSPWYSQWRDMPERRPVRNMRPGKIRIATGQACVAVAPSLHLTFPRVPTATRFESSGFVVRSASVETARRIPGNVSKNRVQQYLQN